MIYIWCRSAYEQSIFCDVFHSKDSGWRECTSCGKVCDPKYLVSCLVFVYILISSRPSTLVHNLNAFGVGSVSIVDVLLPGACLSFLIVGVSTVQAALKSQDLTL